jgi:hypothetical protein
LERGIVKVWEYQTMDEQATEATRHNNGQGFRACDAPFLSSLSEQIQASTWPAGRRLSPKQREHARKCMVKYAGQLLKIVQGKM